VPYKKTAYLILSVLISIVISSGCAKSNDPAEKMYTVLEQVVQLEKGFEQQQDPLISLEKKEQALYNQIIGLGMKQHDQIVNLSDQAIELADERKIHMEKETNSIKKSEKKFKQMADLKKELDDSTRKQADELYVVMMKRYKAHDILNTAYLDGIAYDKELYGMFKNQNPVPDKLETQITKINKKYQEIYAANEDFNKLTEEYNAKKQVFYQKAGFKIKK
jgi:hypothetical protein